MAIPVTNNPFELLGSARLMLDRVLRMNPRGLSDEEFADLEDMATRLNEILSVEDHTAA